MNTTQSKQSTNATKRFGLFIVFCMFSAQVGHAQNLVREFVNPPASTKPWCLWYWLDGKVSQKGITRDLETLAQLGVSRVLLYNNIYRGNDAVSLSESQRNELTRFALRESKRLGLDVYMFNCPGWSQSGGPWIKPEQSMRRVTWKEFTTEGGHFEEFIRPDHELGVQDIAVLAIPRFSNTTIKKSCKIGTIEFVHSRPFVARSLSFTPNEDNYHLTCTLYAILPTGERVAVRSINERVQGQNAFTSFMPLGEEIYTFEDVTAEKFILEVKSTKGIEFVEISSQPKVEQVVEKQLGRMHPTPSPDWNSYKFPQTVEPADAGIQVKKGDVVDLTNQLAENGVLSCNLPNGKWTIIYFGMTSTGKKIHPAPPEDTGLECDKMSRSAIEHNFKSMFDSLLKTLSEGERSALTGVTIDSWEVGSQNWTDGFDKIFEKRNGYSLIPFLPVMTGKIVDNARTSDQFLDDLRRTIAETISDCYVGGLRDIAKENGMQLWMENYGHWGFPGEFLNYAKNADHVSGEFWTKMQRGNIECRAASSAGHIYGKSRIFAEAFTSKLDLTDHPYVIKARGDEIFCLGINHFVLHVSVHQPVDGSPGLNPDFGTALHRNSPWFNESRNWIKYLQRCHYMLQQGEPAADVAVYIGDFAPQMIGPATPVPPEYDFDYINSDVILNRLSVIDRQLVVFDEQDPKRVAARWQLLAIPKDNLQFIRPQVIEKLDQLIEQGGNIVYSVPVTSEVLVKNNIFPVISDPTCEVRWVHRRTAKEDIFFVSNFAKTGTFSTTFRCFNKSAEIFCPYKGLVKKTAWFSDSPKGTRVSLEVKDRADSFFIVLRDRDMHPLVASATKDGSSVNPDALDLHFNELGNLIVEAAKGGHYSIAMSNGITHQLDFSVEAPEPLLGPWKISFDRNAATSGNAFSLNVKELLPWNQLSDQRAKSFIGSAKYETDFNVDADVLRAGKRHILDLGQVNVIAVVKLNGHKLDALWMPPFESDVTHLLKPGQNQLTVKVTSTNPCTNPGLIGPVRIVHLESRKIDP